MKGQNKKIIYLAVAVVAVVFIGWHLQTRDGNPVSVAVEKPSGLVATSTTLDVSGIKVEGSGNGVVSIERVPGDITLLPQPIPNLDVPEITNASLTPEIKEILTSNIRRYSDLLKKDPSIYDNWINLGLQLKIGNEFERTRLAWEYASRLSPTGIVSFINLGDLYGYYLKQPKLAEERFLTALKNDPSQLGIYIRIADFYLDVMKDQSKASSIVKQGLVKFPDNPELLKYKI